jgi:hypothetical protein
VSFKKAIELGEKAMAKSNAIEKSELNKIIGYFNLKKTSSRFLQQHIKEKKEDGIIIITNWVMRITSKMILKMLFHNSINYKRKDFVAQNAYYHLGKVT